MHKRIQNIVPGTLMLLALCGPALTQAADTVPDTENNDSIWTRDKLFGDWGGARSGLAKHGVGVDVRLSQFYQDVTSGGADPDASGRYGKKLDTYVNIDVEKLLGTGKDWYISMHVETRHGKDVLADAGTATLPNAPLLYPEPGDYSGTDVTSFFVTKVLFDGKAAVLGGKLGSLDLLQGMFPDVVDYGLDGFQNANSIMSILSWGRWLTLSQYGFGGWTIEKGMPSTGLIVTGATNTSSTWDTKDSFSDGNGFLAFHRFLFDIEGKDGYLYVGGGGSTKKYPSLDYSQITLDDNGAVTDEEKNPWGIAFYWYQVLWQPNPDKKDRRVQAFTGFSLADDNPSFSDWDAFASIQSYGLFNSRPRDRIGIAGHYYHYADDYVDLINRVPGQDVRDYSWTTELFYNFEINKWLHLTPSLQYVQNEQEADDPATIPGVRLVVDF
jgi:porin